MPNPASPILQQLQPAVFLDRDNTLITNDGDLGDPDAVRLIDGVAAGLKALHDAGFRLIVVTNQGGVARGAFGEADVDAVHLRIAQLVDEQAHSTHIIDRFYYCPYHPEGTDPEYRREHHWRKPSPGMILQASRDMGLDLARSWLIGDQHRDVAAGKAAGCRTIMLTSSAEEASRAGATLHASSFIAAVQEILAHAPPRRDVERNGHAPSKGAISSAIALPENQQELRRSIIELADEIRADRVRRNELTPSRVMAGLGQLLALLCALMALVQLHDGDAFVRWMAGAILLQLVTLTLLLLDWRA